MHENEQMATDGRNAMPAPPSPLNVVTIIGAIVNRESLSSGIIVNGFFVVALLKAISVGQKEQAQLESMPKAQVRNVA
jgi:hypothetical protein